MMQYLSNPLVYVAVLAVLAVIGAICYGGSDHPAPFPQKAQPKGEDTSVHYLSICDLRMVLNPGQSDEYYAAESRRISVRSALRALTFLDFVPALKEGFVEHITPETTGDGVVLFAGDVIGMDPAQGLGRLAFFAYTARTKNEMTTFIPMDCDLVGDSVVAAVPAYSKWAGDMPLEITEDPVH